jgi:hypothetical protein
VWVLIGSPSHDENITLPKPSMLNDAYPNDHNEVAVVKRL